MRACYDDGKRCAETLFFDYHRQHRIVIKLARIFNTYGPRMRPDDGRVVSTLICQALAGEPITIFGSGHQSRSFCYVDDLVEGLTRLMQTPDEVTGPVNLRRPQEHTMLELAEKVLAMTHSRSSIVRRALPADEPVQRLPDIELARKRLGWEPVIDLDRGLQATVDYVSAASIVARPGRATAAERQAGRACLSLPRRMPEEAAGARADRASTPRDAVTLERPLEYPEDHRRPPTGGRKRPVASDT